MKKCLEKNVKLTIIVQMPKKVCATLHQLFSTRRQDNEEAKLP